MLALAALSLRDTAMPDLPTVASGLPGSSHHLYVCMRRPEHQRIINEINRVVSDGMHSPNGAAAPADGINPER